MFGTFPLQIEAVCAWWAGRWVVPNVPNVLVGFGSVQVAPLCCDAMDDVRRRRALAPAGGLLHGPSLLSVDGLSSLQYCQAREPMGFS